MPGRYAHRKVKRIDLRISGDIVAIIDNIVDYLRIVRPVKRGAMYNRNAITEALLLALLTEQSGEQRPPRSISDVVAMLTPAIRHIAERRITQQTLVDK